MNSIDDFSALRPDLDEVSSDELDAIWSQVSDAVDSADRPPGRDRLPGTRRRRLSMGGAAAAVVLGVIAVASVADRTNAPGTADDGSPEVTTPMPTAESTIGTSASERTAGTTDPGTTEVGGLPTWAVTAPGWALVDYRESGDDSDESIDLYAGPEGVATSWVAIVTGMSEALGTGVADVAPGQLDVTEFVQALPDASMPLDVDTDVDADVDVEPAEAAEYVSSQRIATDEGTVLVIAGGVSDGVAGDVFQAVQRNELPPYGFTDSSSDELLLRTQYRFESEDGEVIVIEVQGGGQPRYDVEVAAASAIETWEYAEGFDRADIAYVGEYTLLARSGFWVSRITTSAPFDAPTTFTRLAQLAEVVADGERQDVSMPVVTPEPLVIDSLAIGDSVMLGAAQELVDAGFVVDATESRSFRSGRDVVQALNDQGRLARVVVLALGNNGPVRADELDETMKWLSDSDRVVVLTSNLDRDYVDANNDLFRALPATYPNVAVLDWAELANDCPGDCLEADGFHLRPDGREYFAGLVATAAAN